MTSAAKPERPCAQVAEYSPLFDMFEKAGYQLYAVGGCVRDWCLGRVPKDIDFTTDATPTETEAVLSSNGMKVIPLGEAFGTVSTLIGHRSYEITSFRVKESYTKGSRHPVVRYGKELSQDLERRDLTINAMAVDRNGVLIDPFGGLGDLESGVLRVPRSTYARSLEIFSDDPLRIMRLARFLARLNFRVDEDATHAASDAAGSVLSVSHERWFAELDGLLRAPWAGAGLDWLESVGVLGLLLPEMAALRFEGRIFASLSNDLDSGPSDESLLDLTHRLIAECGRHGVDVWPAFLGYAGFVFARNGDWGGEVTQLVADSILQRLRVSVAFREQTLRLLTALPKGEPDYRGCRETAIRLATDLPGWLALQEAKLACLKADCRASEEARLARWRQALQPYVDDPQSAPIHWPQGLSRTLTREIGVQGKTLGLCLRFCSEAVLNGELSDADSVERIVEWARTHFESLGAG